MTSLACGIATWFVADDVSTATFFPQVERRSDSLEAQRLYWRCVVCFYASSLAVNPDLRHVFFTTAEVPVVDGLDIAAVLGRWGVEVVNLPITRRLPIGSVESWGNQFYVLDVIEHWAEHELDQSLILLDSDCIWIKSAAAMVVAIADEGALTYKLDYPVGYNINGISTSEMATFVGNHSDTRCEVAPYYGGEIFAASSLMVNRIAEQARRLWPAVLAQTADSPREEAHLLSVIYSIEQLQPGTANAFIRRMWTAFKYRNIQSSDFQLTIWHLPAEKNTGFCDLFAHIARNSEYDPRIDTQKLGLNLSTYCKMFGIPRRSGRKFTRDLARKLRTKFEIRYC